MSNLGTWVLKKRIRVVVVMLPRSLLRFPQAPFQACGSTPELLRQWLLIRCEAQ